MTLRGLMFSNSPMSARSAAERVFYKVWAKEQESGIANSRAIDAALDKFSEEILLRYSVKDHDTEIDTTTLVEKLKAATKGSRELDLLIAIELRHAPSTATYDKENNCMTWSEFHDVGTYEPMTDQLSNYTTSLDVALTLHSGQVKALSEAIHLAKVFQVKYLASKWEVIRQLIIMALEARE